MHRTGHRHREIPLALALVLTAGLVAPAAAQDVKYKRTTPKINIKVEQTERTAGIKEKPKAKQEMAPEITADAFLNIEGQVKAVRQTQIEEYRLLIEDTPKNSP